ncbi:glycosyltransferase family 2 protein [Mesorhizobium sp. ANAO-SY3R2]|uniref:glycosyltransferase family 2 protein n=1 Tax=Mesorhizobium sp. ANAO-SY3R2 TaxID=3166644 RepID=UPI0036706DB6
MTTTSRAPSVTVIVNTYNWASALNLSVRSLMRQTDRDFEIVIADDGSKDETKRLVDSLAAETDLTVTHVWHEDIGFRRTQILNKAIQASRGDYLIFLDGDCITQPDFIRRHRQLAKPSYLVTGSRIMLGPDLSAALCERGAVDFGALRRNALRYRASGDLAKVIPLFVRLPDASFRNYRKFTWRRVKGCNIGCWKQDALKIGGYDEGLTGWGHEDVDFVFRMYEAGVERRSGTWATEVLHIWHKMADRSKADGNWQIVLERMKKSVRQ